MQFPKWNPGVQKTPPTASQLNRMSDAAQRADGAFADQGGNGVVDLSGGRVVTRGPEREIWVRITSAATTDNQIAKYAWELAIRDEDAIVALGDERSGTATEFPAIEMNGNTGVPLNSIVRARVGEDNDLPGLEFDFLGASDIGCVELVTGATCVAGEIILTTTYVRGWGITTSATSCG